MRRMKIVAPAMGPLLLLAACNTLVEKDVPDSGAPLASDAGSARGASDGGTWTGADGGDDGGVALQNNAAYVTASGPSQVAAGQSFTVRVTLQNTGTTTWSQQATGGYSLGTQDPQDNTIWGTNRFPIPAGDNVPPGAQYTFTATLTAPATPGIYPTQGQMVQDGVGWFGQMTPIGQVTVLPAGSLTVTVEAAGGSSPVTSAYVKIDTAHQGAVDGTGTIQWLDAPTAPYSVVATAPYCATVVQSIGTATTRVVLSMTCGPATPNTDELDLSQAVVENSPPDTPSWPITAPITELDLATPGIYINFVKRNGFDSWPDIPAGSPGAGLQYTLWIVLNINGQWYASGVDAFWRGLEFNGGSPSGYAANLYYDAIRWPMMVGYQPSVGELVGFFVSAGAARNVLDDSGTLVLERSNVLLVPFPADTGQVYFVNGPCGGLAPGGTLGMGQAVSSCDGRFTLTMQNGGDLALTWSGGLLWDDAQDGHPDGVNLVMQWDGNLVSYYNEGSNGGPIWNTGTSGNPGASMVLDNGGNLSVVLNGTTLWQTSTGGH
jgi:hypothetical protein